MALTIYGTQASPFVRKVRVFLAEKGLAYTLEPVNIFDPPAWFSEISPLKRIPVLRDSDVGPEATLPDSSVICAYLERKVPNPPLYPRETFAYARALWFEEYADSELAFRLGMGVFRAIVVSQLQGKGPDIATARKTMTEQLPRYFDYLDKEIRGRSFYVGDSFTIADIAVATHFANLKLAGGRLDPVRWPALADFVERIHARPAFATLMAEEAKLLPPPVDFAA